MSASVAFEVEDAAILARGRPILDDLRLEIPDHAVTVIVGPGGTGKSVLAHALSGRALPEGMELAGRWRFRGRAHPPLDPTVIEHWRQRRRGVAGDSWRVAAWSMADALILDEPEDRTEPGEERSDLAAALARFRTRGASIVVTHDLALARRIADVVVLLCAGRIDTVASADTFFASPPTDLAAQFVAQGNCWPRHPLPGHFHWVRPGLAGMARPGLLGDVEAEVAAIAAAGVELLVSLTEQPPPRLELRSHGIASRHFPVVDMGVPAIAPTIALCRDMARVRDRGRGVAVHCHAGVGRTGTILAAFLVTLGTSPDDAVAEVRRAIRGAIQSRVQLDFIYRFADSLGGHS